MKFKLVKLNMGRLFWKIFSGFWLTLLLTGAVVGGLIWQHNKERIEQLEVLVDTPRADVGVNRVVSILRDEGVPALQDFNENQGRRHHRPFPVFIVNDEGGELFGRRVPELLIRKAQDALNENESSAVQQVTTPQGEHFLVFIPRRDHPALHKRNKLPRNLPIPPLVIVFMGSLLFSAGLAWYITRPIRHLREATIRFSEGKFDTRVMPDIGRRQDEITDLARDFDHMAEQVQQLVDAQKRLLNDVSHELRSPLARLQVAVEMGRQQPDNLDDLLQRIEKESQRLDELVGELLTLSRLEAGVNNTTDYFDLNGLLGAIVSDARFEAENQGKQIVFDHHGEVLLNGSIELLRRAIENVVRNAIFYTPQSGRVTVTLNHKNQQVEISVCDNGEGVSEDKLGQLFLPFVRINENRQNVKLPGYGLGLAIARRAIEIHQGSISAYNHQHGGLCITMCLPV